MINGASDINVKTVYEISNLFRPDEEGESAEAEAAAEKRASEKEPRLCRLLNIPILPISILTFANKSPLLPAGPVDGHIKLSKGSWGQF